MDCRLRKTFIHTRIVAGTYSYCSVNTPLGPLYSAVLAIAWLAVRSTMAGKLLRFSGAVSVL